MGYTDKTLTCSDCGTEFTFSSSEQEFFASKGFTNEPGRCPDCRAARKQRNSGGGYGGGGGYRQRQMYQAVCASCGKECQVPFEPRNGRPVYCSQCYTGSRR
ncbi:MAG: zinc-ribbon domain containing protein [Dehalococcoidia bacterium]|nr:zinc-ribbon domain containing protein [Dehalococcoidia bacterium]